MNGILLVSSFCDDCSAVYISIDFLGTMFACGDSGVWVAPFFEKLAYFLTFVVKIGVVTTKLSKSFTVVVRPLSTLLIKSISIINSPRVAKSVTLSFVLFPFKYFFNLHLLTCLFCPTSLVILEKLDSSPSRATGQYPFQLRLMGY